MIQQKIAATTTPNLQALAGDVVREMIRRDPELWARVRKDAALWRQFGFDEPPAAEGERRPDSVGGASFSAGGGPSRRRAGGRVP